MAPLTKLALARPADPAQRVQRAHLLLRTGRRCGLPAAEKFLVALGGDGPERDGVHADAPGPIVDGQRPRQALDRGLGGRVRQGPADRALRLV
jgi:hypothetical protein